MAVVNSEVEQGEQPVVQIRYSIVMATSKRARQIIDGRVAERKEKKENYQYKKEKKPLSVAIEELHSSKVKIVGDDE